MLLTKIYSRNGIFQITPRLYCYSVICSVRILSGGNSWNWLPLHSWTFPLFHQYAREWEVIRKVFHTRLIAFFAATYGVCSSMHTLALLQTTSAAMTFRKSVRELYQNAHSSIHLSEFISAQKSCQEQLRISHCIYY